jgi:hypothetical protein
MKHLTALSDQKYILYGVALIDSLEKSTIPWRLHYYCVDDQTYQYITSLRHSNVIAYRPDIRVSYQSEPTPAQPTEAG